MTMDLLGIRKFVVHYGGNWKPAMHKYIGGKAVSLGDIDGDEFCYIDLMKDIKEKTGLSGCRVQWVHNGALNEIASDSDILHMWGLIKAVNGLYHLYVEDQSKGPTTINPKSPVHKSIKKPQVRRSPRLAGKFKSRFISNVPVVLSDSEAEGEDVSKAGLKEGEAGTNEANLDDDWAINNLVQSTCAGIDFSTWDWDIPPPPLQPNSDPIPPRSDPTPALDAQLYESVYNQCQVLGLNSVDPEEEYHSGTESEGCSEEEDAAGEEATENAANDEAGTSLNEKTTRANVNEEAAGLLHNEFSDFIKESDNLYEDEDDEKGKDGPTPDAVEELHLKMVCPTMEKCRKFMRTYAILKKFEYKQKRNDNLKIHFVCRDPKCMWRVYVRKLPHEATAMLRSFNGEHTCKSDEKDENRMAHAGWVANQIEQQIRGHKQYKPKDVQVEIWDHHGVRISYHTAYQAKVICHERIYGSYKEGYKMCPEISRQIIVKNPGSISVWLRNPYDNTFVSLLVCFKGSIDGFINGCRPVLGLDGTFLKGKYGGCLLSIVSLDGNNGLFPIAIYVCRGEDYDNWSKFLSVMKPHLLKHNHPLTFISDRAKGLRAAVAEVFPDSHHRFCFRHMYKNFKGASNTHKGPHMEELTWGAAKAYRREDHENWMAEIEKVDSDARKWLDTEEYTSWCRSYFDTTSKCEHVTNNFSESFNKMILTMRDMPLTKLIEKYQLLVMSLLYNRKLQADQMDPDGLVSSVESTIAKRKKKYNKYTTAGSSDYLHLATNKHGKSWTVDLKAMTCTCCQWQISGIPCIHAMSVIIPKREDWRKYCSPFFTVNTYKAAYEGSVIPMEDCTYWPQPQHKILPPPLFRPPGRPRTNRIKQGDEPVAEKRGKKKCSKCGELGHNKRSCKGLAAYDNGRRVKPRVESEGPSIAETAQPSRPQLIVPSMPIPKTTTTTTKRGAGKKGGTKRGMHKVFRPPGPAPPQSSMI